MDYQAYKEFEKERQVLFERVINSLPQADNWSIVFNDTKRFSRDLYEADAIIKKDGINYALVDIRNSARGMSFHLNTSRKTAYAFKCKIIFLVFRDIFYLLSSDYDVPYIIDIPLNEENIKRYLLKEFKVTFSQEEWKDFFDDLADNLSDDLHNKAKVDEVLREIGNFNCNPDESSDRINIPLEMEEKFFKSLIEEYDQDEICRFTSLSSLFRSLNEQKQSLCSIVCMNDKSEVNYTSNYLYKNKFITTKLHPGNVGDANKSFILSCCSTKMKEDLTMMRLYADDAKGVVICYKILDLNKLKSSKNFILGKINYQRKNGSHPELDLIGKILSKRFGSYTLSINSILKWSHFFKPYEYSIEEEVRLLYTDSGKNRKYSVESKWIHDGGYNILAQIRLFDITNKGRVFPFAIDSIILAPKMKETLINREQLEMLIKDKNIRTSGNINQNLVDISKIDHYR